jgi:hypothetical protein
MKDVHGITYLSLSECIQYTAHYLSGDDCSTLIRDLASSDILTEAQKTELINLLPTQEVYTNNSDYLLSESFIDDLDTSLNYYETENYTYEI